MWLGDNLKVPSINETSINTVPCGCIDQNRYLLAKVIHVFATMPTDRNIFTTKWNIKDGFLHLDCSEGEERDFA